MRALNGNIKNTLTLAHWNRGSSFLGKSDRGIEKLQEIENFLLNNKIDVLGLSEANLDSELEEYNFKKQGYQYIKSPGNVSRIVTYVREDLVWKELKNYKNNLSCNWLEVGKGKNKIVICNYYREFKILGIDGPNQFNK